MAMTNSMSRLLSTSVTAVDDLRVVTNNSGAVVHLLAGLLAVLGHDVLALLDVGRVHHHVVVLMAQLLVDHVINNQHDNENKLSKQNHKPAKPLCLYHYRIHRRTNALNVLRISLDHLMTKLKLLYLLFCLQWHTQ